MVPAHGEEGGEEEESGEATAGGEERLEEVCADVGDVRDPLVRRHAVVLGLAFGKPDYYHHPEHSYTSPCQNAEEGRSDVWGG